MLELCYNIFLLCGLLLTAPVYLRRMRKRGGYRRNFGQRFGFYSRRLQHRLRSGNWIWIRAVSVGEMMQGLALATELQELDRDLKVVISTTTSTGYALGNEKADPNRTVIIYSPFDFSAVVARPWQLIRPRAVVLIDSDLWPAFLSEAARRHVPVYVANARLSQRSERRYRVLRRLAVRLLWTHVTLLCAQDDFDAVRWRRLGLRKSQVKVTGSLKYDTALQDASNGAPDFRKWLASHGFDPARPILLGGSLHAGEEALLCRCFCRLRSAIPDLFLILAPRHAERTPEIETSLREQGLEYTLRSQPSFEPSTAVLVINSTGELKSWYHTATVVVVGKSFLAYGGQNPIEPILAGKPVVCGPHMENFGSLISELRNAGAIVQLETADHLTPVLDKILRNPAGSAAMARNASRVLDQHRGATERTAKLILDGMRQRGWVTLRDVIHERDLAR